MECSKGRMYEPSAMISAGNSCGGCLGELERLASGLFTLANAWSMAEIAAAVKEGTVAEKIIPPLQALAHLPRLELDAEVAARIEHGMAVPAGEIGDTYRGGKPVAGVAGDRLAAILKLTGRDGKEFFHPVRVFPRATADG